MKIFITEESIEKAFRSVAEIIKNEQLKKAKQPGELIIENMELIYDLAMQSVLLCVMSFEGDNPKKTIEELFEEFFEEFGSDMSTFTKANTKAFSILEKQESA